PSARDKCYHAMAGDFGPRPHELLKLRIKDIVFKLSPDNRQYAEVLLSGKTGTRSIPLIDSIPYVKDWILQHPQSGNPNSILLCGFGRSLNRMIQVTSLNTIYKHYKEEFFPALLDSPNVPPEDKPKIRELLKKKWNPYVRRHSSLTKNSKILKEYTLKQLAGWSPRSQMPQKYIHYFGNESNDSILEAYGIETKDKQLSDVLRPKLCPNCYETNKPDSKFCVSCRMVLTYDAYSQTLENQKQKDDEFETIKEQLNCLSKQLYEAGILKKD
ncbi:MAG: site-specific integrase, partial [Thermoproteota archaeon]|nr:site-specific integrase [Thermoproteota archaeon]